MQKGAYLVIEHTEALHVIDVNSGNRSNKARNQEETAMEVNMISAPKLRVNYALRDMGGIVVSTLSISHLVRIDVFYLNI